MTIVRKPYDKRERVQVSFRDENGDLLPPMTEQHHKQACDVDLILRKYDKTGLITHVNNAVAHYGDYTEVNEYQECLNLVNKAKDDFLQLPSEIRKRFENDPGLFFEFAGNPANRDALVELGLAEHPSADVNLPCSDDQGVNEVEQSTQETIK